MGPSSDGSLSYGGWRWELLLLFFFLQLLFIDTQVGTIATGLEMLHSRMEVESAGCDCSDS